MSEISNVVIICRPEKYSLLKEVLKKLDIYGMTVMRVEGCGLQGGKTEYYRGTKLEVDLLPKTRVELVVPTEQVQSIVDAAKSVLKTGKMGDGKIFVYAVERVVRISNESEGMDALDIGANRNK